MKLIAKMKRRISEDIEQQESNLVSKGHEKPTNGSHEGGGNETPPSASAGKVNGFGSSGGLLSGVIRSGSELTSRASSGLSMIVDNYDEEISDAESD